MSDPKFDRLSLHVRTFPRRPGVYLMKNSSAEVIYVGKAADLRTRVHSYLSGRDERYQVRFLMSRVEDIEFVLTDTEKEALILEDILIKKYRPRYNICLKDDKTYLSLKIDTKQPFPRVEIVRKRGKDGARYFGPYASAQALRETLALIQRVFMVRSCNDSYFNNRVRPCLSYQIKRCSAPCCGYMDSKEYKSLIEDVVCFLEGRDKVLIKRLEDKMLQAAKSEHFEEAARVRDSIESIKNTLERQKIFTSYSGCRDVLGLFRKDEETGIYMLFVRGGKVSGGRAFTFLEQPGDDGEMLSSFILGYYGEGRYLPSEIVVQADIHDSGILEDMLSESAGRKVRIVKPLRGDKVKLLALAIKNAEGALFSAQDSSNRSARVLERIKQVCILKDIPSRMECFDISNTQGKNSVASMVVFIDGNPETAMYRRYSIKSVEGADDFASMHEVLSRRVSRGLEEGDLPDLIVVDGGRGQLGMAMKVLSREGVANKVGLVALAKEKVLGKEKKEERIYIPGRKNPLVLSGDRDMMHLFQRIRDEAHRFALAYHRNLRSKAQTASPLDLVKGLGSARKKVLMGHFKTLDKLRSSSIEEISSLKGISETMAADIISALARNV